MTTRSRNFLRAALVLALALAGCQSVLGIDPSDRQLASDAGSPDGDDDASLDAAKADAGASDSGKTIDLVDADLGADGAIDAGDWSEAGAACNELTSTSPWVEYTMVAGDVPDLDGGIIEPGTWVVTALQDYNGDAGGLGGTGEFTSETWELLDLDAGGIRRDVANAQRDDAGIALTRLTDDIILSDDFPGLAAFEHRCIGPMVAYGFAYSVKGSGPGATLRYNRLGNLVVTLTKK